MTEPGRWRAVASKRVALSLAVLVLGVWLLLSGRPEQKRESAAADVESSVGATPALAMRRVRAPRHASTADEHAAVSGRVSDARSQPIAGAGVCASCNYPECGEPGPPRTFCALSDADGAYGIAAVPSGRYRVSALARGYQPGLAMLRAGTVRLVEVGREPVTGVDVTLTSGGALVSGRVLDATGGPIPAAQITGLSEGAQQHAAGSTRSDEDGRFELPLSPGPALLQVSAAGYAWTHATVTAPTANAEIVLTPASTIHGITIDALNGLPVVGVEVRATKRVHLVIMAGDASAHSDADGRFTIEGLSDGSYELTASAPGWFGRGPSRIQLGVADAAGPVRLALQRAAVVRGTVSLEPGGEPCPRGTVLLASTEQAQAPFAAITPIDPGGRATFAAVMPGSFRIEVQCEGRRTASDFPLLTVRKDDLDGLRWPVAIGARIVGRVVDRAGRAQPGRELSVVPAEDADEPGAPTAAVATTDAHGAFDLTGLAPGAYRLAVAGAADAAKTVEAVAAREPTPIVLLVPTAGTIRVELSGEDAYFERSGRLYASGPAGDRLGIRAGQGRYEFRDLQPGRYEVSASDGRTRALTRSVQLAEGAAVELRLALPRRTAALEGRVIDAAGEPVADAWVRALPSHEVQFGDPPAPVLTDRDGAFVIPNLASGERYDVEAEHDADKTASASSVTLNAPIVLTVR